MHSLGVIFTCPERYLLALRLVAATVFFFLKNSTILEIFEAQAWSVLEADIQGVFTTLIELGNGKTVKFSFEFVIYFWAARFKLSRTCTHIELQCPVIFMYSVYLGEILRLICISCRPKLGDIRLVCDSGQEALCIANTCILPEEKMC